uniref:chemerin-like receptor 1 n=1 Tax=Pristiophorus japonicus TaxID=55135 RepID=UPI00398E6051
MVTCIVTCVLGVSGNGLVIWATGFQLKRTANTIWFLSLAMADFTFSLVLPLSITELALDFQWPFGRLHCKFYSGTPETEPEDFQLTNSSEVPHPVPATESYFGILVAMIFCRTAIQVVTCILGASGNGLVIWATGFKLKRTSCTVWLLSLAVADFTLSLLLPLSITDLALDKHWPFGRLLCKLHFGVQVLCLYASVWMLAAVSVDRCVSVVLPIWSLPHPQPAAGHPAQPGVIATSYTITVLRLRWGRLAPSGGKSFKFIAPIILAFLLCWAPHHMYSIVDLLLPRGKRLPLALSVVFQLSFSLAYFNICINPVLHIFTWQDFRDLLKKSLQWVDNQGGSMQRHL